MISQIIARAVLNALVASLLCQVIIFAHRMGDHLQVEIFLEGVEV